MEDYKWYPPAHHEFTYGKWTSLWHGDKLLNHQLILACGHFWNQRIIFQSFCWAHECSVGILSRSEAEMLAHRSWMEKTFETLRWIFLPGQEQRWILLYRASKGHTLRQELLSDASYLRPYLSGQDLVAPKPRQSSAPTEPSALPRCKADTLSPEW